MKFAALLAIIGAAGLVAATCDPLPTIACHADNCLRGIGGTAAGEVTRSARLADCSSYFETTVISPTVTVSIPLVTVHTTVVSFTPNPTGYTITPEKKAAKRTPIITTITTAAGPQTIKPTSIPYYASTACDGNTTPVPVRYSSACSCLGVTPTVTTLIVSTATANPTTTITSTTDLASTFKIAATGTAGALGYLYSPNQFGGGSNEMQFTADQAQGARVVISVDPAAQDALEFIDYSNIVSEQDPDNSSEPIFFAPTSNVVNNGWAFVSFTVHADLSITAFKPLNGYTTLQTCAGVFSLTAPGATTDYAGNPCSPISLTYVPIVIEEETTTVP